VEPGDLIHVDHFSSPQPRLIPQTSGKLVKDSFYYGTMYLDSASDYIHYAFQKSTNAKEMVDGKHRFEYLAIMHNVKVKAYHSDNHVFNLYSF